MNRKGKKPWEAVMDMLLSYRHLGCRETASGVRLIGHVPRIGPEAHLHTVYPPLPAMQVEQMEGTLGVTFPESIRQFYSHSNGLNCFVDVLSIFGKRKNYVRTGDAARQPFDLLAMNAPGERPRARGQTIVVIGGYDWDGSHLYFDGANRPERIFRCSRDSVVPLNSWPNFWTMLYQEVKRLSLLFSDKGVKLDPDQPTTPKDHT